MVAPGDPIQVGSGRENPPTRSHHDEENVRGKGSGGKLSNYTLSEAGPAVHPTDARAGASQAGDQQSYRSDASRDDRCGAGNEARRVCGLEASRPDTK